MATTEWRDMSVPYKPEEYEGLREIFRSMPTFRDNHILTSDFAECLRRLRFERTPEQVKAYEVFWQYVNDGKFTLDQFMDVMMTMCNTAKYFRLHYGLIDKDKNGCIDAEEFVHLMELLTFHDPRLAGKTYQDFVREADTNKDGQVDIEECAAWVEQYTQGKFQARYN